MSSCRARSDMVETLFVPGKPMQHREADTLLVSLPLKLLPRKSDKGGGGDLWGLTEESALLSDTYSYTG